MHPGLKALLGDGAVLVAVAAPAEARAVFAGLGCSPASQAAWTLIRATPHADVVITGVGKANAAGAVARTLDPARHAIVLSVGVAGTYGQVPLGAVVAADSCIFADEGVQTPDTFQDIASLGFAPAPTGQFIPTSTVLLETLRTFAAVGPIATVSTCSGTDALASSIAARSGAIAEAMEGAAVALVAHHLGVPMGELRVISNTTGNRAAQQWRLQDALVTLQRVIGELFTP